MNKFSNKKKPVGLTVGKIVILTLLSLLFLFLSVTWFFLNVYKPNPIDNETNGLPTLNWDDTFDFEAGSMVVGEEMANEEHPESENITSEAVALKRREGVYTFLIIGRDAHTALLTDTMMVMIFDAKDNKIGILNIPRDSYINNSYYRGKLNGALGAGYSASSRVGKNYDEALVDGIKFLRQMITVTFGIPIDYYLTVDLKGFKAIVTAVGGVEVDVPVNMFYEDPEQGLYINLKKGPQLLDANKAEQFVRYRSYADADIGRIRAQKTFISALAKKMMKFDLAQIERIVGVINDHVVTNLPLVDAGWFATKALGMKLENVIMHTVPGEGFYVGKAACYAVYKPETIEIINGYYNPYKEDIPEGNFNIYGGSRIYAAQADISGTTMDKFAGD